MYTTEYVRILHIAFHLYIIQNIQNLFLTTPVTYVWGWSTWSTPPLIKFSRKPHTCLKSKSVFFINHCVNERQIILILFYFDSFYTSLVKVCSLYLDTSDFFVLNYYTLRPSGPEDFPIPPRVRSMSPEWLKTSVLPVNLRRIKRSKRMVGPLLPRLTQNPPS